MAESIIYIVYAHHESVKISFLIFTLFIWRIDKFNSYLRNEKNALFEDIFKNFQYSTSWYQKYEYSFKIQTPPPNLPTPQKTQNKSTDSNKHQKIRIWIVEYVLKKYRQNCRVRLLHVVHCIMNTLRGTHLSTNCEKIYYVVVQNQ